MPTLPNFAPAFLRRQGAWLFLAAGLWAAPGMARAAGTCNLVISAASSGAGSANGDVIQVTNPCDTCLDISGMQVYSTGADCLGNKLLFTFPSGTLVSPGASRLLAFTSFTPSAWAAGSAAPDFTLLSGFASNGTLELRAPGGLVLDKAGFGASLCAEGGAAAPSLPLGTVIFRSPSLGTDTGVNASDFQSGAAGNFVLSAGGADNCGLSPAPSCKPVIQAVSRGGNSDEDDVILLYNPCGQCVDISAWSILRRTNSCSGGTALYTFPAGSAMAPGDYRLGVRPAYWNPGQWASAGLVTTADFALSDGWNGNQAAVLRDSGGADVDLVGLGGSSCFEGAGPAPEGLGQIAYRSVLGADSGSNSADFSLAAMGGFSLAKGAGDCSPPPPWSYTPTQTATFSSTETWTLSPTPTWTFTPLPPAACIPAHPCADCSVPNALACQNWTNEALGNLPATWTVDNPAFAQVVASSPLGSGKAMSIHSSGGVGATAIYGLGSLGDTDIEAEVWINPNNGRADLLAREQGNFLDGYHFLVVPNQPGGVQLLRRSGPFSAVLNQSTILLPGCETLRLRFVVSGSQLVGYVNEIPLVQAVDSSYAVGRAGVHHYGTATYYDNFRINNLVDCPASVPTFTPTQTQTFTSTHTFTDTHTSTWTDTATATFTHTDTATWTSTSTPTWTPTATATWTASATPTPTHSSTPWPSCIPAPACASCNEAAALACQNWDSAGLGDLPSSWIVDTPAFAQVVAGTPLGSGNAMRIHSSGGIGATALVSSTPIGDTDIEADVWVDTAAGGRAILLAREQGNFIDGYHFGGVPNAPGGMVFSMRSGGGQYNTIMAQGTLNLPAGCRSLRMRFVVKGHRLEGYINGQLLLSAVDSTFATGRVGVHQYGVATYYDNFRVNDPGCAPPAAVCLPEVACPTCTGPGCESFSLSGLGNLPPNWLVSTPSFAQVVFSPRLGNSKAMSIHSSGGVGATAILTSVGSLTDTDIEADVWVDPAGNGRAVLLAREQGNFIDGIHFQVVPNAPGGMTLVVRYNGGLGSQLLASGTFALDANCSFRMRLKVVGNEITGYLNGIPALSASSPAYASGRAGVHQYGAATHYDNFRVNDPGCPAPGEAVAESEGFAALSRSPKQPAAGAKLLPEGKKLVAAPNPVRAGAAELFYRVENAGKVRVLVFDLAGAAVSSLSFGEHSPGDYRRPLEAAGWAQGVYYVLLQVDSGFGYATKASFKMAVARD